MNFGTFQLAHSKPGAWLKSTTAPTRSNKRVLHQPSTNSWNICGCHGIVVMLISVAQSNYKPKSS
ncbi:MAG TPA: hypothetical protein PKE37_17315, partial [Thiomonas arsenitoxydans]|uniref:hypothetical protein n=1 Tax=Thiomonas arsenitoxydans (strain DSM 22701 / CIP 110005 / 3As) TaxID=426114 RepID=UPI002B7B6587